MSYHNMKFTVTIHNILSPVAHHYLGDTMHLAVCPTPGQVRTHASN